MPNTPVAVGHTLTAQEAAGMGWSSGSYSPSPVVNNQTSTLNNNPNGLTNEQVAQGYSTIQGAFNPVTGQRWNNQSTTTLSNQNKIDQIPHIQNTTNQLSQTGIQTDANGNQMYANGTAVQPPQVPVLSTSNVTNTGGYLGESYIPPGGQIPLDSQGNPMHLSDSSPSDNLIMSQLNQMKAQVDSYTASYIDNIQSQFNTLIQQQQQANKGAQGQVQNALLNGGISGQGSSAQYAPISSAGILTSQINYGIQQIASLNTKEQTAILEAKKAGQDQNFQLMDRMNNEIVKVRDQKIEAAVKLQDKITKANEKLVEAQHQASVENSISDLYSQGITDPAQIQNYLNYHQDGTSTGGNVPLKTVADTVALVSGIGGSGIVGEYNFYRNDAMKHGQVPVDFNTYQNMDANRKKSIARAGVPTTTTDEDGNVITTGNYDALTIGRYNKAANAATAILQKNPTFKNIIGSSAYLDRIEAAIKNPGSVGDQELLDSFTQLNTGGNRVTEAQVHLITSNQSLSDVVNKYGNKLKRGGALSTQQRQEIVDLAHEVYKNYQKSYAPLYKDATSRLEAQGIPKQFWNIPSPDTLSRAVSDASGGENTNTDLIESGEQAKQAVQNYGDTAPPDMQKKIATMASQGISQNDIYEWLKKRNLIQ